MTNNILKNKMSLGKKFENVMKYLLNGGEFKLDGRVYVWLDNHITHEEVQEDGTVEYFGIDGLAMKMTKINSVTKEETPHYVGMGDMTLTSFIKMLDIIDEETWVGVTASNALRSMIPDRG